MWNYLTVTLFGFLYGYPLLQLWTLLRCRGWWRVCSLLCLIPTVPFYATTLRDFLFPQSGSLWGLLVLVFGPVPVVYLTVLAIGFEVISGRKRGRGGKGDGDNF